MVWSRTDLKKSTGETIDPKFWDKKKQRATLDRRTPTYHVKINNALETLAATVSQIFRDSNFGQISIEDFKQEIDYRMGWRAKPGTDTQTHTHTTPPFLDFLDTFVEERKRTQPRGTWKILQTVAKIISLYAQERARKLNYDKIDFPFFSDFRAWLYAPPRCYTINYASKVADVLKQFMREAQRRGFHSKTDYEGFSIKKERTFKLALSFDELETLYRLDLTNDAPLRKTRDLFLVGAYTGLRFSDFTRIRPEHIETATDGTKILNINTQKTGQKVSIPLFEIPETILRKYNFSAPKMSNQKMNSYLKELGKLAGFTGSVVATDTTGGRRKEVVVEKWEMLSTHVARRSFATNFYLQGYPPLMLMKITGHTTEQQFMNYISIDGRKNAVSLAEMHRRTERQNNQ